MTILEQIITDIVDTLSDVTIVGGYYHDLEVEVGDGTGTVPRDSLVRVVVGDPIPLENSAHGFDEFHLPVGLAFYAIEGEGSAVPISTRLAQGAADIRKALAVDLHRGGFAINTLLTREKDDYQTEVQPAYVLIKPFIHFRTLYNNPSSLGG